MEESKDELRKQNFETLQLAKLSRAPKSRTYDVVEDGQVKTLKVTRMGSGPIQTPVGNFELMSFHVDDAWEKYSLLHCGELDRHLNLYLKDPQELLIRIDSGCETGQLFLDQTCECREQLHEAMREVSERGEGMIINIPRQDGRGMGLPFKLATLRLQLEFGVDTVQAAAMVEPVSDRDTRTYAGVIGILKFLKIDTDTSIVLATNNPKKTSVFQENGYSLTRHAIIIEPTEHTRHHLEAKNELLGHMGSESSDE